ncbi:MAG TPA: tetratricopeptide repeat-containing glycosyltransferase family protein [Terracidiphilus sp.]|jgi:tetratricopeptide (TPR) repeat protein
MDASSASQIADLCATARHAADAGNLDLAIQCYEKAIALDIALDSKNVSILLEMGNLYAKTGQASLAIQTYNRALQIDPDSGFGWSNLGNVLFGLRNIEIALQCFTHAVRLLPDEWTIRYSLGRALGQIGKANEAVEHLSAACALNPAFLNPAFDDAWIVLGNAYQHSGDWDRAMECFDRALAISPNRAEVHLNRAMVLLNQGNFSDGWREYEYRWETPAFRAYKSRGLGKPRWQGEPLDGKRILLHAEQGFGDAIQFARFIPELSARGAEVFVEAKGPLKELFSELVTPDHIIELGNPLPEFDYDCPLMSLPIPLGLELSSIPNAPYLKVPSKMVDDARSLLTAISPGTRLRVGIVWTGNSSHPWNAMRSVPLAQLAPLGRVKEIQLYSLQREAASAEAEPWPEGSPLALPGESLEGFQRMAAVIQALDLVISIDTAQAHLAGALGKPVWVLLPLFYEWRWHSHLEDSPWYPSARLFRQQTPGEWTRVIQKVAEELQRFASEHRVSNTRIPDLL